jgi:hypothetical protein
MMETELKKGIKPVPEKPCVSNILVTVDHSIGAVNQPLL